MHPDVEHLREAIHNADDNIVALRAAIETLVEQQTPELLRAAIVGALREAAQDPAITRAVYDTMTRHARTSLAQYVGERVLTAAAVLVVSAVLAWSWITGHIK